MSEQVPMSDDRGAFLHEDVDLCASIRQTRKKFAIGNAATQDRVRS
jgi:hypothetical protein